MPVTPSTSVFDRKRRLGAAAAQPASIPPDEVRWERILNHHEVLGFLDDIYAPPFQIPPIQHDLPPVPEVLDVDVQKGAVKERVLDTARELVRLSEDGDRLSGYSYNLLMGVLADLQSGSVALRMGQRPAHAKQRQ
ncbi:hypothetical protein JCM5296_003716 [Sporobolomyces johnsonii]